MLVSVSSVCSAPGSNEANCACNLERKLSEQGREAQEILLWADPEMPLAVPSGPASSRLLPGRAEGAASASIPARTLMGRANADRLPKAMGTC